MNYVITHCPFCNQKLEKYLTTNVWSKHELYCKTYGIGSHNFQLLYNVENWNLSCANIRDGDYILKIYYGLNTSKISRRASVRSAYNTFTDAEKVICSVDAIIPYDFLSPPDLKTIVLTFMAFS